MAKPPESPRPPLGPETGTQPDDIPAVHVLEAAQAQDRKETEDLLQGFDRPSREPKRPELGRVDRDFVDYYTKKKGGPARPRTPQASVLPAPQLAPTQVKARWDERPAREMPPWASWVGIGVLMLAIGAIVAFVATSEPSSAARAAAAKSAAATTTITAGISPSSESTSRDAIPAPTSPTSPTSPTATPEPMTITTTPMTVTPSSPSQGQGQSQSTSPRTKRDHSKLSSAGASTPGGNAAPGPTSDDMIRDM